MAARATTALADEAIEAIDVRPCAEHTRGNNVTALSAPRAPIARTDTVRPVADGFMAGRVSKSRAAGRDHEALPT